MSQCAPTSSVGTTTVAPNATSTTTAVPSNATTTTVASTTTGISCCPWPLQTGNTSAINTANPIERDWDKCSGPITFNCSRSDNATLPVGIAVDWPIDSSFGVSDQPVLLILLKLQELRISHVTQQHNFGISQMTQEDS
uniref:Uncharacterized protein n=1 Tax=Caenorhabditis tropicalis TaxID=1561998 RepID=A0A1I7U017_9PELO